MSHESSHINPDRFADSAGVSWSGRQFESNSWAGDDGTADANLIEAVQALRSGSGTAESVLDALRTARVLIPLLALVQDTVRLFSGHIAHIDEPNRVASTNAAYIVEHARD
jgi:hypothetical protein